MKRLLTTLLFLLALLPLPASANTYQVTNTNDWFWGSLRQAIDDANNHAGLDTIVFNIGSGPKTIILDTPLPAIKDRVVIDGWTQPGWTGNPIIELNGSKVTNGLGLMVYAPSTIRGLAINRFGLSGIGISDDFSGHVAHGTIVQGCWIGLGLDGLTGRPNGRDGIRVFANDVVIGGDGPNQRNVIVANAQGGIAIGREGWGGQISPDRGMRTRVQGNFIGVNTAGSRTPNTQCGIEIYGGMDNVIGGDTPALGNVIAGNGAEGIKLDNWEPAGSPALVQRTVVRNNRIGTIANGNGGAAGIAVYAPLTTIERNTIAFNNAAGVLVRFRNGTLITNNSISKNGGLGIDLGAGPSDVGVTPNDVPDSDTGGNDLQNFPVITNAVNSPPYTRVAGRYQGAPNQTLTFDFYKNATCDGSGYGEGETFLGSAAVTTNPWGWASFDVNLPAAGFSAITATARDANGSTSELSQCRQVDSGLPAVTGYSQPGGRAGTMMTLSGSNFTFVNKVYFNGMDTWWLNVVNDNTITVFVPAGAGIGPIKVSGPYGSATGPSFRITPPVGDLSGDGLPDLIWRNYRTGENSIAITNGPTVALPAVSDPAYQIAGTGDFNNDGSYDILWRDQTSGDTRIWLMNGTTYTYVDAVLPKIPDENWYIDAIGDFDGDADPDLVWRSHVTGMAAFWIMDGTTFTGTSVPLLGYAGPDWRIEATGDFDLDGRCDLLWRNYLTGENEIWHMNGTNWPGVSVGLLTIPDPNWIIEGAADWDQDGDLDVLWRHQPSGTNAVWRLVGTYWDGSSITVLPAVTDTDMRVEDY